MLPIKTIPQRGKAKVNLQEHKASRKAGQNHAVPPVLPRNVQEHAIEAGNRKPTVNTHQDTDIEQDQTIQKQSVCKISPIFPDLI